MLNDAVAVLMKAILIIIFKSLSNYSNTQKNRNILTWNVSNHSCRSDAKKAKAFDSNET